MFRLTATIGHRQSTEHTANSLSITADRAAVAVDPREAGDQTACKPGSVPPASGRDDHSSGPPIAGRFSRPTRTPQAYDGPTPCGARNPYSVLLLAGLAMPSLSPGPRWALTPPFHPCPGRNRGGLLSVALSLGSPPAGVTRRHVIVEPGLSSTARRRPRSPGHLVRAEPDGPGERGQEPLATSSIPIDPIGRRVRRGLMPTSPGLSSFRR